MIAATALVALALAGANPPTPTPPPAARAAEAMISYQVRVLEMKGLGWRTEFHHGLKPVARRGTATVWTLDAAAAGKLAAAADRVIQAPKVSSFDGSRATVFHREDRHHVAEVRRVSDGEPFRGTRVAFQPKVEGAGDGWKVELRGRTLDQGVLAEVAVESTAVAAVHAVAAPDGVHEKGSDCCLESGKTSDAPLVDGAVKAAKAVGILATTPCKSSEVAALYQVPEVVSGRASGEWLIPTDGCLAIGLGVYTVADADGKAVARERVMLVSASAASEKPAAAFFAPAAAAPVAANTPMPAPAMPSRTLPQGFGPDGVPAPLPPLPDEQLQPVAHEPNQPTPQAPPVTFTGDLKVFKGGIDFDINLSSRRAESGSKPAGECEAACPEGPEARVKLDPARLARLETQTFRFPLSAHLALEFTARLAPAGVQDADCQAAEFESPKD